MILLSAPFDQTVDSIQRLCDDIFFQWSGITKKKTLIFMARTHTHLHRRAHSIRPSFIMMKYFTFDYHFFLNSQNHNFSSNSNNSNGHHYINTLRIGYRLNKFHAYCLNMKLNVWQKKKKKNKKKKFNDHWLFFRRGRKDDFAFSFY